MPDRSARPTLGASYAATRERVATWQRLKANALAWADGAESENALRADLTELARIESYFAYPGHRVVQRMLGLVETGASDSLARLVSLVVRMLVSGAYRLYSEDDADQEVDDDDAYEAYPDLVLDERPYFEVLVVDDMSAREADRLRERLLEFRTDADHFVYDVVVLSSFEDALIAVLLNHHIQSVVIRYSFPVASRHSLGIAERALARFDSTALDRGRIGVTLGEAIHALRPEVDLFLVSDATVEELAGTHRRTFRRIFFRQEDLRELHLSILKGVQARYETPFFSALRRYSQRPTGVFHALPIARGKSISRSHWIREMEDVFGSTLFMSETSATTGGLDSLLQPHGSLREAQGLAARAFGAERTFFVTNGTSTANKIVLQALTQPGDIVLAARDCHMSHHYAFVLCGAQPVYLDPYPLRRFGFYGGVPLETIKRELVALRDRGELHRARVLLLTNCTFDGIVYNPLRVMEEVLAIQPDMTFVWDEAWFAFAAFTPITRRRTAMASATELRARLTSAEYRARYAAWRTEFDASDAPDKWLGPLMADPDRARVRVYATQSTHKTLTSMRQGSMIHVHDQDFASKAEESFHQAYLTHTSTSANYPILASLDIGRRQVELEGYELVQHAIELALVLRERVNSDPHLTASFRLLSPEDLIPERYRPSGFTAYRLASQVQWDKMDEAWESDEFCLDPTRLTLFVGATGIRGEAFKSLLIDRYDIQVNKTSANTALFMTHIGTTRGAVAHLVDALCSIADEQADHAGSDSIHRAAHRRQTRDALTGEQPPLPDFSSFHPKYHPSPTPGPEGDVRAAFFRSVDEANVRHLHLDGSIQAELDQGKPVVAAAFVTPYPPGFPILVPGQVISPEILAFLKSVTRTEIHGYDAELGLRVFTEEALQ